MIRPKMYSLVRSCMEVVLDTHENIEDLSELMLRPDEESALARALRIRTISKMVIPADINAVISDVIHDKLAVYAQTKQEHPYGIRNVQFPPDETMMTEHKFTHSFRPETQKYSINFFHVFYIELPNRRSKIHMICFTNPRKSRVLTYEEAKTRPDYKEMKTIYGGP